MNQLQMDGREYSHLNQAAMERMLTPIKELVGNILPDMDNDSQPTYQRTHYDVSKSQTGLLRKRPIVKAEKTANEIIGQEASTIKPILIGWGKARERTSWEEYAAKIAPATRDIMAAVFAELRRNGYVNPSVNGDKIVVDYICYHRDNHTDKALEICTLCERECSRKDWRGVFKKDRDNNEVKRCWV
jgi:hypothetical protein